MATQSTPRPLLNSLRTALQDFANSPSTFRIIRTIARGPPTSSSAAASTSNSTTLTSSSSHSSQQHAPSSIFVLDSSFNPPTKAHLRIASSALQSTASPTSSSSTSKNIPKRLLLLLATQNADKAPKPASFEQRLAMMGLLAEDLLEELSGATAADAKASSTSPASNDADNESCGASSPLADSIAVDIGVTKLPYFVDKARAIAEADAYQPAPAASTSPSSASSSSASPASSSPIIPQTHLIGFDTLIRILDPNYYPPQHTLAPLAPLFAHHSLRVTFRPDDGWGGRDEQRAYVEALEGGEKEDVGGRREWAQRVELVEGLVLGDDDGDGDGKGVVSSTRLREAAKEGGEVARRVVGEMCSPRVAGWVLEEGLYKDDA